MTDTERAAWAAFEAGIVEDAIAAGMIDNWADVEMSIMLMKWFAMQSEYTITANGDGTWSRTYTPKGGRA